MWGALAGLITPLLWLSLATHRKRTLQNLIASGRTPGEADRIGKASFRSGLLVLFESLAMPRLLGRKGIRVESTISLKAEEAIERLRTGQDRAAFAASGHTGVWEFAGAELARLCAPVPLVVSARLVKNPVLKRFLVTLRRSFGLILVEKEEFLRYLVGKTRKNDPRVYIFLCDQHFRDGAKVPFMNRQACTVSMPAALALKYGGALFVSRCVRKSPGHYLFELDLLDLSRFRENSHDEAVRAITVEINRYIEESIQRAPEQWLWGHRRWRKCCNEGDA